MEQSILKSTKKILGIGPDDTSFDEDVLTHINSAFSTLHQVGAGPGIIIDSDEMEWDDLEDPYPITGLVRTYVYLKVRMLFDPPQTSYLITAMNEQLAEHLGRISIAREESGWTDPDPPDTIEILDGGDAD